MISILFSQSWIWFLFNSTLNWYQQLYCSQFHNCCQGNSTYCFCMWCYSKQVSYLDVWLFDICIFDICYLIFDIWYLLFDIWYLMFGICIFVYLIWYVLFEYLFLYIFSFQVWMCGIDFQQVPQEHCKHTHVVLLTILYWVYTAIVQLHHQIHSI